MTTFELRRSGGKITRGKAAMADSGQMLKVQIPPNACFSGSVRQQVVSFARRFEVGTDVLQEFIFALGEALSNAIEHAHSKDVIEVRCQIERDKILAVIVDSGAGFQSDTVPGVVLPDGLAERGRGLPIMRRCTDIFAVHSVPGRGTAVVLGRYLHGKSAGTEPSAS